MKVILSTGHGRLHLVQSATHLGRQGVDITLVQGWVPHNPDSWLVRLLSRIAGSHNLAAGFRKRRPEEFKGPIRTCAFSEFFLNFLFLLSRKLGWPSRSVAAKWGWQLFGWQTRRYLRDADIFHVRSGAGQGGAIAAAKSRGMKVITDHSIAHSVFMEKALRSEYQEAEVPFMLGSNDPFWSLVLKDCVDADVVLVNSYFVKQTFVEAGFVPEKIAVAYLGVRTDFQGLKKNYAMSLPLRLLFTGGFGFRKGAKYLLQALQILDQKGIAYEFTVAGTAAEAAGLLRKYPVKGKINLLGHIPQEDLKTLLANADIYVFPSLSEGCASSLMEALAAGLPVVTTVESGAPITEAVSGCLVPAKDAGALADKIEWLKNNPAEAERIGCAAAQLIRENYTWEHYAKKVKEVYEQLLKEKCS